MKNKLLSIIVPCYNEEKVIEIFYNEVLKYISNINYKYEFIFIDDGSKDNTINIIKGLNIKDKNVSLISFSRNFGKEAGIYAGLKYCKGDLVVVMDVDLQHPPRLLPQMVKYIEKGYDTVTTKRISRNGETKVKKIFADFFYKIVNIISTNEIKQGSQDFRMMKKIVVDAILSLSEYNRFSKGIFSWVGFKTKFIEVENVERVAGKTKWSFFSLFKYAIEGIIAFSTVPLKIAIILGVIILLISIIFLILIILKYILYKDSFFENTSTIMIMLFMSSIQLIAIGILSHYIAKIYYEVKDRPKYIVREYIESEDIRRK